MSDFLSNLAARSKGTLETIGPRVPSRYEPVRKSDGVLAGRTPAKEEAFEGNAEMEGAGDFEITADFEPKTTRGIDADGSSTRRRRILADVGKPRIEADEHGSEIEPGEMGTVSPVAIKPMTLRGHEASEGETQNRSAERSRRARQSPSVGEMRPDEGPKLSSAPLPDSGRIAAPSVRTPAFREQRNARSDRTPSAAGLKSETEPPALSSLTSETNAERSETPIVQSQPKRSMPRTLEPGRTFGIFADASREESVSSSAAMRPWPGDAALKPEAKTRPMPGDEAAFAPPSERAAAERPVAPNRQPALQQFVAAQSDPSVQVTIGRVEVRAVFAEQPVKRTPPPRFRPRVTLDEYLNRGGGAKR